MVKLVRRCVFGKFDELWKSNLAAICAVSELIFEEIGLAKQAYVLQINSVYAWLISIIIGSDNGLASHRRQALISIIASI